MNEERTRSRLFNICDIYNNCIKILFFPQCFHDIKFQIQKSLASGKSMHSRNYICYYHNLDVWLATGRKEYMINPWCLYTLHKDEVDFFHNGVMILLIRLRLLHVTNEIAWFFFKNISLMLLVWSLHTHVHISIWWLILNKSSSHDLI